MLVSAEELAWALDTHLDFARAVLDRIRAKQHRQHYVMPLPLPVVELVRKANRDRETKGLDT